MGHHQAAARAVQATAAAGVSPWGGVVAVRYFGLHTMPTRTLVVASHSLGLMAWTIAMDRSQGRLIHAGREEEEEEEEEDTPAAAAPTVLVAVVPDGAVGVEVVVGLTPRWRASRVVVLTIH